MSATRALRSGRASRARRLGVGFSLVWLASGCSGLVFYDVTRTQVNDCDITPMGEFCSEGGPAVREIFAVERRDAHDFVYFGEEMWVVAVSEDETVPQSAIQEQRATREPGPCTTTLRQELTLLREGFSLRGEYLESTRIEGPPACGDTPRGTKKRYALQGNQTGSL